MNIPWDVVIRVSTVLLVAAILSILLKRATAATRHGVWTTMLAGALLLPFAAAVLPGIDLPLLKEVVPVELPVSAAVPGNGVAPLVSHSGFPAWLLIWLAGAAIGICRTLLGFYEVWTIRRRTMELREGLCFETLGTLAPAMVTEHRIELRAGNNSVPPMTWGFRKHRILLPAAADQWPVERIQFVLAHELAHVQRRDGVTQLVAQIACAMYWFNPLVWYAAYRMRLEREHACDDHVLNLGADPENYAGHLIEVARSVMPSVTVSAASMIQLTQLEARVRAILDSSHRRRRPSTSTMAMLAAAMVSAVITAASLHLLAFPGSVSLAVSLWNSPPPVHSTKTTPRTTVNLRNAVRPGRQTVAPEPPKSFVGFSLSPTVLLPNNESEAAVAERPAFVAPVPGSDAIATTAAIETVIRPVGAVARTEIDRTAAIRSKVRDLPSVRPPEAEEELGGRLASVVESTLTLVDDATVNDCVNRIGQNLARTSALPVSFKFRVVATDEMNGFAIPGGYVYIDSGLIAQADSEAELAAVMAHLMAQTVTGHMIRMTRPGEPVTLERVPRTLAVNSPTAPGYTHLITGEGWAFASERPNRNIGDPSLDLAVMRADISEADSLGLQYLYRAGYDPTALADILEKLQEHESFYGTLRSGFPTHPPTKDRIADARKDVKKLHASNIGILTTAQFDETKRIIQSGR